MKDLGFIKIHRKIKYWEWADNVKFIGFFTFLLIHANWKDQKWKNQIIEKGSFITSLSVLAKNTKLTIREVRTLISKLKETGEIQTENVRYKYTKIIINNYSKYQSNPEIADKPTTSPNVDSISDVVIAQQTSDKRATSQRQARLLQNDKPTTSQNADSEKDISPFPNDKRQGEESAKNDFATYTKEKRIVSNKRKNIYSTEKIKTIIDYLNKIAKTNYRATSNKSQYHIQARLNEKYTIEEFKHVIDVKCQDWLGDDIMKKYLRPETLFGPKFEGYLNEEPVKLKTPRKITSEENEDIDKKFSTIFDENKLKQFDEL